MNMNMNKGNEIAEWRKVCGLTNWCGGARIDGKFETDNRAAASLRAESIPMFLN